MVVSSVVEADGGVVTADGQIEIIVVGVLQEVALDIDAEFVVRPAGTS